MDKIPVNVITGFLGAGKTTAIIKLLHQKSSDEQWAVIINEFGKISIDSQTLRSSSTAGEIFDISGGCICCSAKGYFNDNLNEIIQSGKYSRIIIEPSGLGGIDMVSEIVIENPYLELMPITCLVDIVQVENARLQMVPIYRMQILKSDIIVFTKCDVLNDKLQENELILKFNTLYPGKYIQKIVSIATLNKTNVLDKSTLPKFRIFANKNNQLSDSDYQKKIFTFDAEKIFDIEKLTQIFVNYPEIIRAKGYVKTENGWKLMNYTFSGCNYENSTSKEQTDLVVITENLPSIFFEQLASKIQETIIR